MSGFFCRSKTSAGSRSVLSHRITNILLPMHAEEGFPAPDLIFETDE